MSSMPALKIIYYQEQKAVKRSLVGKNASAFAKEARKRKNTSAVKTPSKVYRKLKICPDRDVQVKQSRSPEEEQGQEATSNDWCEPPAQKGSTIPTNLVSSFNVNVDVEGLKVKRLDDVYSELSTQVQRVAPISHRSNERIVLCSSLPTDNTQSLARMMYTASAWVNGQYDQDWKHRLAADPYVFDFDDSVESTRALFLQASSLFEAQKSGEAFSVLNEALENIPKLLRQAHPQLLFEAVEISCGMCMLHAPAPVRKLVKNHVSQIAAVMLGTHHPVTQTLGGQFDSAENGFAAELLMGMMIKFNTKNFGHDAHQTASVNFAFGQWYLNTGRPEQAQTLMALAYEQWSKYGGKDCAIARLAEALVSEVDLQLSQQMDLAAYIRGINALHGVAAAAKAYGKFGARRGGARVVRNVPILYNRYWAKASAASVTG